MWAGLLAGIINCIFQLLEIDLGDTGFVLKVVGLKFKKIIIGNIGTSI